METLFLNYKLTLEPEYRTSAATGKVYVKFHAAASFNRNARNRQAEKSYQPVYITATLFGDLAEQFDAQGYTRGDILSFVGEMSFSPRSVKSDDESNIQLEVILNDQSPLIPLLGGDGLPWVVVKFGNPEYMEEPGPVARATPPPPPPARPTGLPPSRKASAAPLGPPKPAQAAWKASSEGDGDDDVLF